MLTENLPNKKRTLQKVRRNFVVTKKTDSDEHPESVDPTIRYISNKDSYLLNECLALVEMNRRIYIGSQFLSRYFNVNHLISGDDSSTKAITLCFSKFQDGPCLPIEYLIRRLESYGDLELATWAHRIAKHNASFPKLMKNFIEMLNSSDRRVDYNAIKGRALKACTNIESSYSYYRVLMGFGRNTTRRISCTYGERFLKELGYTIESFASYVKEYGAPSVFDGECSVYMQGAKSFLECTALTGNPIFEWPEYETTFTDTKGEKKKAVVQFISILEPTLDEEYLFHCYFVLKSEAFPVNAQKSVQQEPLNVQKIQWSRNLKCLKLSQNTDINLNIAGDGIQDPKEATNYHSEAYQTEKLIG